MGPADPRRNPIAAARLPGFEHLLSGARPLLDHLSHSTVSTPRAQLSAIDANLGIDGRPQSGTGQTALLTGLNAAELLGRHFGPWVPTMLREQLKEESIFARAIRSELRVAFANAYPSGFMDVGGRGARRPGAFPFAAHGAGVLTRSERDVRAGGGLVSSISTEGWRRYVDAEAPPVTPAAGGEILCSIGRRNDLTVFAHYDTDYAGHRRNLEEGVTAIERVDAFLASLTSNLPEDILLIVTSDHGNLEDSSTGHTRNSVPLLTVGPGAHEFAANVRAITDITPTIMKFLESPS